MKEVFTDLETLSNKPNALIISIGACYRDEKEQVITFYRVIRLTEDLPKIFDINLDTIRWWMQRSNEAREVFSDTNTTTLRQALLDFAAWLPVECNVWGFGAMFDNVGLKNAYDTLGIEIPWTYRNDMCLRTLTKLFKGVSPPESRGVHHNALADAEWALNYYEKILKACPINLSSITS